MLAEAELNEEPEWGLQRDAEGLCALSRPQEGGPVWGIVPDHRMGWSDEPTLRDLSRFQTPDSNAPSTPTGPAIRAVIGAALLIKLRRSI